MELSLPLWKFTCVDRVLTLSQALLGTSDSSGIVPDKGISGGSFWNCCILSDGDEEADLIAGDDVGSTQFVSPVICKYQTCSMMRNTTAASNYRMYQILYSSWAALPPWYLYLVVVEWLACLNDPESYAGGGKF